MSGVNNKGKLNQNLPLPSGWEIARDETGKIFYVDHISRKTQWFDPRDKLTKPLTVADCIGDELPFGWEAAFAPGVGVYYIDHIRRKNQLEDPRVEWRNLQINMLNSYLQQAEGGGSATDLAANVTDMDPTPTDLIDVDDALMRSVANVNEPIYEQTRPQIQQQVQQMPIRSPLMDQSSGSSTFLDRVTHLETNDPSLQSSLPVGQMTSAARQMNKEALEKSLVDARARVERLKRDLDANFNLLSIIDKYYKKGNNSFAVEV